MSDTKLLQAILDNQISMRQELKQMQRKLSNQIKTSESKLTQRIDNIGKSIAFLEEDAPTREEFDNLENRVNQIENRFATTA